MCDTLVVVLPGKVLFAKNSDRDPNEAQLLEWRPRRRHPAGATVRCTWIEIPQVRETHAVLLSRPFWMWGAEMGANEHGVVIGNEAVFTDRRPEREALTGMDLLRLALERAASAREAVEVIVELLEVHGQGGGCGFEHPRFTYSSSFLAADPGGAFLLETAGREWVVEELGPGVRSLSNGLTVEPFASRHADRLRTRVARAAERRARTAALAAGARSAGDLFAVLRDHGPGRGPEPDYGLLTGALGAPCAHAGGLLVGTQTTASWVSELSPGEARHWVTATAAPCTGLFKPVRVLEPLDLGPAPTGTFDPATLFWRHERLHRRVLADPARLLALYAGERDAVEARWLADPPDPAAAFAEGDRLLEAWTRAVARQKVRDRRPLPVRRYWSRRNRRAGMP